jgi:hypothetical protein
MERDAPAAERESESESDADVPSPPDDKSEQGPAAEAQAETTVWDVCEAFAEFAREVWADADVDAHEREDGQGDDDGGAAAQD